MSLCVLNLRRVCAARLRKLSSSQKVFQKSHQKLSTTNVVPVNSAPPYVVKAAIVGSSVGLASPFFAIGGVGALWFNYLPKTTLGNAVKYGVALLVGGGFTTALVEWIIPFLTNNSDFILPFAVSNGVAATFWYTVAEWIYGPAALTGVVSAETLGKKLPFQWTKSLLARFTVIGIPVAGPVIGALTAMTSPFLWPLALKHLWNSDTQDLILGSDIDGSGGNYTWLSNLYEWIFFPVGLPVGVLSGLVMHYSLKNSITGVPGKHWTRTSLPVLAVLAGASGVYFGLFKAPANDLVWYERMDPLTTRMVSFNARTGETLQDGGKKGRIMQFRRGAISVLTSLIRDPFRAMRTSYFSGDTDDTAATAASTGANADGFSEMKEVKTQQPLLSGGNNDVYRPRDKNGLFSAHHIDADIAVHKLIDVILHEKYLQLNPTALSKLNEKQLTKTQEVFKKQCDEVGIKPEHVANFIRFLEIAIVSSRFTLASTTDKNGSNSTTNVTAILKKSTNNVTAADLLLSNLHLLEGEYRERLGYTVTDEKGKQLVEEVKSEVFWDKVYFWSTITASVAVLGTVVAASMRSK